MLSYERSSEQIPHDPKISQVTPENYVPQSTPRSCGIAITLMARNLLTGKSYPYTVDNTLDLMRQGPYDTRLRGNTDIEDRKFLIGKLNQCKEQQIKRAVVHITEGPDQYTNVLRSELEKGGVILLGFKKPYFELPPGAQVESRGGSTHGALVHGYREGSDGIKFIITDPYQEISDRIGMNISVDPGKLYDCLDEDSVRRMEVLTT